jgi:hypothetical protein
LGWWEAFSPPATAGRHLLDVPLCFFVPVSACVFFSALIPAVSFVVFAGASVFDFFCLVAVFYVVSAGASVLCLFCLFSVSVLFCKF